MPGPRNSHQRSVRPSLGRPQRCGGRRKKSGATNMSSQQKPERRVYSLGDLPQDYRRVVVERVWSKIVRNEGCWIWQGTYSSYGYGTLNVRFASRKSLHRYAHRLVYEIMYGSIPPGMFVCHTCDNPPCCNPDHLFLGTCRDNVDDMVNKGRQRRGSQAANSVLSEEQVEAVRKRYSEGGITQIKLAEQYGVTQRHISGVINGRFWKHVGGVDREKRSQDRNRVRGSRVGGSKLTEGAVREIRELCRQGELYRSLASKFGVSRALISGIVLRKIWKSVD